MVKYESVGHVALQEHWPDRHARWTATRARGRENDRPKKGKAEGTARTLQALMSLTLKCRVCKGLVSKSKAVQAANKRNDNTFKPGDGCGSSTCSSNFVNTKKQYLTNQATMRDAIAKGERILIKWPKRPTDKHFHTLQK